VRYSFDIGAIVLMIAMLWTIVTTREYPPAELHGFADATPLAAGVAPGTSANVRRWGALWLVLGSVGAWCVWSFALRQELFILCGMIGIWGLALLVNGGRSGAGLFSTLMTDILAMPRRMRQLIPVQFFSWLALFAMWIYTTPAVTGVHFGSMAPGDAAYNAGANWVGVLFAAYSGFAALAAIIIPQIVRRVGLSLAHGINLGLGAIGIASFLVVRDPDALIVSMVGVGFAWASIVSLPYALLADSVPSRKMGVYMGIFNFFIVIPQLVAASALGAVIGGLFEGRPIYALLIGGGSFLIAGAFALRVK
jgi:maltose/moltooligosaccharide transporter